LVLFHVEQFLQLFLKHLLYKKIGDYPKTRSLVRLIKDTIRVYGIEELKNFIQETLKHFTYLKKPTYLRDICREATIKKLPKEY